MLTGLSAVTAAYVWTRSQVRGWREQRAEAQRRNWDGYIDVGGINTWDVRLTDNPATPSARVVLDVVKQDGTPDDMMAHNMRQCVLRDGILSRPPTTQELELLKSLGRERGYGKGGFVVR
jgi:hypothetical protein